MMSRSKKNKCWSDSVGVYGATVRVGEREPGGVLYVFWVDASGMPRKRSLRHRDRKVAKKQALEVSHRLANRAEEITAGSLTVGRLVDLYLEDGLHGRTDKYRREAERRLRLIGSYMGLNREAVSLSKSDVDRFIHARKTGKIGPDRSKRAGGVGMNTVWHDLVALNVALNWAVAHRDAGGRRLLAANPLAGIRFPKEVSPARPKADQDYYLALRAVADQLNPMFETALDLAHATGHRIGAILKLRWDDIEFAASHHAPYGSIRWRRENDKIKNEHVVPMNRLAHDALRRAQKRRPGIGAAWVFPADTNPALPVDRHLASQWLRRAEKLAKVERVKGRGWHSFRRGWASARKELPDVDVAAAGGWKDLATMKQSYQQPDAATIYRVVSEPLEKASGQS